VLLLAAGALPAPQCLAAHARWHEAVCDAVSVGRSERCDARAADPQRLAAGELPPAAGDDPEGPAYDAFLEATRALTERRPDLFRIAAADNVALRSQLLGRLSEPRVGADDVLAALDRAYRLETAGCLFVAEPAARCLTHYPRARHLQAEPSAPDARADSLIPVAGFRADGGGRLRARPALAVTLVPDPDDGAGELLECVDSLLAGRLSDLRLTLELDAAHPARAELAAALAADPRVELAEPGAEQTSEAPYRVRWPALAVPDERTLADLRELIEAEGVGALHVTVPGRLDRLVAERPALAARLWRGPTVEVAATGALARAGRIAARREDGVAQNAGALSGERWISGAEVGVHRRGTPAPEPGERRRLPAAADLAHERAEHLRHRARAATNQARSDRQAHRATRERLRANNERLRAERIAARLAQVSPSFWARWRARRAARRARAVPGRVGAIVGRGREVAYRYRRGAAALATRARRGSTESEG
jgi:hypothetical protein